MSHTLALRCWPGRLSVWLVVCVALLVADRRAVADPAQLLPNPAPALLSPQPGSVLPVSALHDDLHDYFFREKRGGIVLMAMGAPAVALGGGLLLHDSALWRGFAYPVLIVGGLELLGGLLFAARTPGQVRKLDAGLAQAPLPTQAGELARMRRVNRQFALLQVVEVVLMAGGVAMAAVGGAQKLDTLTGVGLGLSLQSTGLLLFDVFAARRALRFTRSLERPLQLTAAGK